MNGQAIFLPLLATMMLTAIVWVYMYARRIPAKCRHSLSHSRLVVLRVPGAAQHRALHQKYRHVALLSVCQRRSCTMVHAGQGTCRRVISLLLGLEVTCLD